MRFVEETAFVDGLRQLRGHLRNRQRRQILARRARRGGGIR